MDENAINETAKRAAWKLNDQTDCHDPDCLIGDPKAVAEVIASELRSAQEPAERAGCCLCEVDLTGKVRLYVCRSCFDKHRPKWHVRTVSDGADLANSDHSGLSSDGVSVDTQPVAVSREYGAEAPAPDLDAIQAGLPYAGVITLVDNVQALLAEVRRLRPAVGQLETRIRELAVDFEDHKFGTQLVDCRQQLCDCLELGAEIRGLLRGSGRNANNE